MIVLYIILAIVAVSLVAVATVWFRAGYELSYIGYTRVGVKKFRVQYIRNKFKSRDSIPVVTIDADGGYKFVLIEYNGKTFVRADKAHRFHADIATAFSLEVGSIKPVCLGGGYISVNPNSKTVSVHGTSQGYGSEPDRNLTRKLIEEHAGFDAGLAKAAA